MFENFIDIDILRSNLPDNQTSFHCTREEADGFKNDRINLDEIINVFKEDGLKPGILKSKVNVQEIINKIRMERTDIAWIGVVRYLNIIENILLSIKGTNVNFFVFGDGPELENLKKAVDFHGLKDQVVFLGRYKTSS